MAKKYYQILEISETSTQEEIKKNYRKLALKWHPDKWTTKSLKEKEEANKKIQEINKAYEVLGDEDKRKKYDLGETDFADYGNDYEKTAREAKEEELREKQKNLEELLENEEERARIMEEMWLLNAKYIDRYGTFNKIGAAMNFSSSQVYAEDLKNEGYSKLWEPYKDWLDKVWKMPITLKRGEKEESDELKKFKEEMLEAIDKTATIIETKKKEKKEERDNNKKKDEKSKAIESIEDLITEKALKTEDLGKYSNYQDQINNLSKQWEIRSLRDKIKDYIRSQNSKITPKDGKNPDQSKIPLKSPKKDHSESPLPSKQPVPQDSQENLVDNLREKINQPLLDKENNGDEWNKEKENLLKQIQQLKTENNQKDLTQRVSQLEDLVKELKKEVQELKTEIQELKKENDNNPDYQKYLTQKENQLKDKQSKLDQLENIINVGNGSETPNSKSNNNFPTGLVVIGTIFLLLIIGLLAILRLKKSKKRKI